MKKLLILVVAAVTLSLMSSCRSGCNCPGGGGYKKHASNIEQPTTDNQIKLS